MARVGQHMWVGVQVRDRQTDTDREVDHGQGRPAHVGRRAGERQTDTEMDHWFLFNAQ